MGLFNLFEKSALKKQIMKSRNDHPDDATLSEWQRQNAEAMARMTESEQVDSQTEPLLEKISEQSLGLQEKDFEEINTLIGILKENNHFGAALSYVETGAMDRMSNERIEAAIVENPAVGRILQLAKRSRGEVLHALNAADEHNEKAA